MPATEKYISRESFIAFCDAMFGRPATEKYEDTIRECRCGQEMCMGWWIDPAVASYKGLGAPTRLRP